MGKLHLKRTPEEQRAHDLRKARKAARKAAKRSRHTTVSDAEDEPGPSQKRARKSGQHNDFVFDLDDDSYTSHRAHKPDYDYIHVQMEEERFKEKMYGAFEDDERLDSVEAHFNSYTHIPRRWRGGGMDKMDDEFNVDPQMMEEEDYAEWMRNNMWRYDYDYAELSQYARYKRAAFRRKHAAEYAAREREKTERAARKEREKALHDETIRLEKAEEERRKQRRLEKEYKHLICARNRYEAVWKDLLSGKIEHELRIQDIPWPVAFADVDPDSLTLDAVSAFLLPEGRIIGSAAAVGNTIKKERKDKLRETMLRFHPDKFEGRVMRKVREADKERVRECVGKVARIINDLLAQ